MKRDFKPNARRHDLAWSGVTGNIAPGNQGQWQFLDGQVIGTSVSAGPKDFVRDGYNIAATPDPPHYELEE